MVLILNKVKCVGCGTCARMYPKEAISLGNIVGYDPKAKESAEEAIGDKIKYANTIEEALKDSECALLITDWDEFKKLTPEDFKKSMKVPNLIDGRRIYDYDVFNETLNFRAMGRVDLN